MMTETESDTVSTKKETTKIPAVLKMNIEYTKCEIQGPIFIPHQTIVYIDIHNSIALIGEDHVDIQDHEYDLLLC